MGWGGYFTVENKTPFYLVPKSSSSYQMNEWPDMKKLKVVGPNKSTSSYYFEYDETAHHTWADDRALVEYTVENSDTQVSYGSIVLRVRGDTTLYASTTGDFIRLNHDASDNLFRHDETSHIIVTLGEKYYTELIDKYQNDVEKLKNEIKGLIQTLTAVTNANQELTLLLDEARQEVDNEKASVQKLTTLLIKLQTASH